MSCIFTAQIKLFCNEKSNYKLCLTKFDLRPGSKKKDLSQTRSVCKKFWSKQQSVIPLTKDKIVQKLNTIMYLYVEK